MKKEINVYEYGSEILTQLKKGALITTKVGDEVNTMTISWGSLGAEWNREIFITYVRENRHTKSLLDKNGEFTVNIPFGEYDKNILAVAGKESGRSINKIEKLNLTLVESEEISVPGIKEIPLTLECRVIYKQPQNKEAIPKEVVDLYYPKDIDSSHHGSNKDYHTVYYGEILKAYIIE